MRDRIAFVLALCFGVALGFSIYQATVAARERDRAGMKSAAGADVPDIKPSFTMAPAFSVEAYDQKVGKVTLEDLRGKVVVLDFFQTDCGPCLIYLPKLGKLRETYGDQVEFLSITPEPRDVLDEFFKKPHEGPPVYISPNGEAQRKYEIAFTPTTYVIDPQGRIVYASIRSDAGAVEDKIRELLGKPLGSKL